MIHFQYLEGKCQKFAYNIDVFCSDYFMTTWKDTFENVDAKFGAEFKEDNDVCEYGDYRFISFIYVYFFEDRIQIHTETACENPLTNPRLVSFAHS